MKAILRLTALLLCVCLLLAGTACDSGDDAAGAVLRLALDVIPGSLDPQLAESDEALLIVRSCFEGLFRMEDGAAVPAACEAFDLSADGLTYTFTLRKGLTWSDGEAVTAADFRFGLIRALRPETAAPEAARLSAIVGAADRLAGQGEEDALGIEARSARTLVLRLSEPDAHLPETLTCAMAMPCREDVFTAAAGRYGMKADLLVCNGPLTVSRWGESTIRLTKNEYYTGDFTAKSAGVTLSFGDTDGERIDAISGGMIDLALLSAQSVGAANNARLAVARRCDTLWVLWVRPAAATVGDPAVSAALKRALGPQVIADVLPAGFIEARGLLAGDLKVGRSRVTNVISRPAASPADPEGAQAALVEALKRYDGTLPTLTLRYADEDGVKSVAGRIAQQWQKELGAVVNIEAVPAADLIAGVDSGSVDLALCPLTADDGRAVAALDRLAKWIGAAATDADTPEAVAAKETALLADSHLFPVAQSGRCLAASDAVTGARLDLEQGLLALYKLGKE